MIALSLLALLAAGSAAVRSAFPPATGLAERALRASLALLLGAGLASAAAGATLLCARSRGPASDLLLLALAAPLLLWKREVTPAPAAAPARERTSTVLLLLCAAGAVVFALIFAEHSVRYPDGGWDASAIWNLRARALHRAGSDLALAFPPGEQVPHPDYPLLLPGLVEHLWSALGAESPWVPPLVAALFCAALLALLPSALATGRGPRAGAFGLLLLLGTPTLLTRALSQYADVPLAALLLGAAVLAARALATEGPGRLRLLALAGLCASLAAWTKNEGLVSLLLLAALLALPHQPAKARWSGPAAFLLGALPVLLLLAWFKLRWAPVNDLVAASTTAGLRARLLDPSRALTIARAFLQRLWRFEEWGAALPLVALSWPALWWTNRESSAPKPAADQLLVRYSVLLPFAYAAIYLATPSGLPTHLDSSLDRLLLHWWPVALLTTLRALPPLNSRWRSDSPV